SAKHAVSSQIRLYDRLFIKEDAEETEEGQDFTVNLNPNSLQTLEQAWLEPYAAQSAIGDRFQFMRQGYFIKDQDSTAEQPVFNLVVNLKDTWAKIAPA